MILTDGVHVVSTESEAELHTFAARVGLRREWYQNTHPRTRQPSRHPHYDILTASKLRRAIQAGAIRVTSQELFRQAWWASPTAPDQEKRS